MVISSSNSYSKRNSDVVKISSNNLTSEIRGVLAQANYTDDDAKVHEITARRGFIFHYSDPGYDSIAYGGLKK